MQDRDYRSEADYRPFLRAVRRRMRAGMDACEAIDATVRTPRFRTTVRLGCIGPVLKDVERREMWR
jgi:hypothetical protein